MLPLLLACTSAPGTGPATADEVVPIAWEEACDNLSPYTCLLPWPSDRYLAADGATATGWRVEYPPEAVPLGITSGTFDPAPYRRLDGMSAASQILAMFDRPPDLSTAASQDDIGRSLDDDSPTVLLDLATGERVAHWVENDAQATSPEATVVFLRTAARLQPDRDYAVAFRDLVGTDGLPIEPTPAVAALRERRHTDAPDVEARWDAWQEMADALEAAGVARDSLALAWRFHTATDEALHRDMLHMRADALDRIGEQGIACTVSAVDEDYGQGTEVVSFRRVTGTYTVPSYMTTPEPGSLLVRGADDLPVFVEYAEAPFTAIVPTSVAESGEPGALITYGHGLLGEASSTLSDRRIRYSAENGRAVLVGTDWQGMSTPDLTTIAGLLADVSKFPYLTERLHQSMINQLTLTRTFAGVCRDDPAFQVDGVSVVDPDRLFYAGVSQGGILGGTYLTLAEDIERGVLIVNGAAFPYMMERSIAFAPYFPLFETYYPNRVDRAVLLSVAQQLWEMTEPASWLPYTTSGIPEAGLSPKVVLSIAAENDAQVPNLTTDWAMRTAGVPLLDGTSRDAWGFDVVDADDAVSAYVTIDMGDRAVPYGNVAPDVDDDGHSNVGVTDAAQAIIGAFLGDGRLVMPCDGVCDPD